MVLEKNKIRERAIRSAEDVQSIREKVLEEISANPNEYHEDDIERVRTDDWFVKKFYITRNRNVKPATTSLISSLKWRKSQKVHELKESDLPDVYHRLGSFFVYKTDKEGRKVFYGRCKHYRRNPDLRPIIIQSGIGLGHKIETESPEGIVGIMDFKGLHLTKAFDLEIVRILINTIITHYPLLTRVIYVINLPSILHTFSSMFMKMLSQEAQKRVKFVTEKELQQYIDCDSIPDFLGGTCKQPYKGDDVVPEGSPDLIEYAKRNNWTVKQYQSIYKIAKELADEEGVKPPPPPELYSAYIDNKSSE
ncbi:motile sperm domain-containing protein 2-like [Brevipalpus obovatus]|uniref:motile sperm domain-containing protein 2-like n=1 Tax=Brevipalpus obovatus TaxID=246614 RepID=UPI003D9FA94E